MSGEKCAFVLRKNGERAIYCKRLEEIGAHYAYCVTQYFCPASQRFEADANKHCKIKDHENRK